MKFTKAAVTVLCSALLFCACAKDSDIVLKVNDKPVTKKEFYGDFNRIKNVQLKNAPKEYQKNNGYAIIALKEKYTNDVIVRMLLSQEFDKRKIQASDAEVKAKKDAIIAQMGSADKFNQILKENNISTERLNKDLASEVKMDKLVSQITNVKVSDAELQKFYKENKEQFNTPESVRASHILIDTNAESIKRKIVEEDKEGKMSSAGIDEKVKKEVARKEALLKDIQNQLAKNPSKFAQLAKQYSEDAESAKNGGDLGYITKDGMVPEFGEAAFKQKIGVVGPAVKSQFGTHIILVKDKAKAGVKPFNVVKNDLRVYLLQQKKSQIVQDFIEGLKSSAKIEYIDKSLAPETIRKELDEIYKKQSEEQQKAQKKAAEKQAKEQQKAQKQNKK